MDEKMMEVLGFSRDELLDRMADRLLRGEIEDMDSAVIEQGIYDRIQGRIDEKVQDVCDEHVLTNVDEYIASLVLKTTNRFGEEVEPAKTFSEYIVERAEAYLREGVDYDGKKPDRYGSRTQSRITHLIDKHLHFEIQHALEKSLQTVIDATADGLQETVKIKLVEIQQRLGKQLKVKAGR